MSAPEPDDLAGRSSPPAASDVADPTWPALAPGSMVDGRYVVEDVVERADDRLLIARDRSLADRPVVLIGIRDVTRDEVVTAFAHLPWPAAPLVDAVAVRGGALAVLARAPEAVPLERAPGLSRDQIAALLVDAAQAARALIDTPLVASGNLRLASLRLIAPGTIWCAGPPERPHVTLLPSVPARMPDTASPAEGADAAALTARQHDLHDLASRILRSLYALDPDAGADLDELLGPIPDVLRGLVHPWLDRTSTNLAPHALASALGVEPFSSRIPVPVAPPPSQSEAADRWAIRAAAATRRAWIEVSVVAVLVVALGMALHLRGASTQADPYEDSVVEDVAVDPVVEASPQPRRTVWGPADPLGDLRAVSVADRVPAALLPESIARHAIDEPPGMQRVVAANPPAALRLILSLWADPLADPDDDLPTPRVAWAHVIDASGVERSGIAVRSLSGALLAMAPMRVLSSGRWEGRFVRPSGGLVAEIAWSPETGELVLTNAAHESLLAGCAAWRLAGDSASHVARVECIGRDGALTASPTEGWQSLRFVRDPRGRVVRVDAFREGAPIETTMGWSSVRTTYEPVGRIARRSWHGRDGVPVTHARIGAARIVESRRGSDLVLQLLSAEGQPTVGADGWHEARWDRGEVPTELIWSVYDLSGQSTAPTGSPFAPLTLYRLAESSQVVERAHFRSRTQPALDPRWQVHRTVFAHDSRGRIVGECDFDLAGPAPSERLLGAFCVRSVWTERSDDLAERLLLDVFDGAPLRTATGRAAGAVYGQRGAGRVHIQRYLPSGVPAPQAGAERLAAGASLGHDPFRWERATVDLSTPGWVSWDPRLALEGAPDALLIPRFD